MFLTPSAVESACDPPETLQLLKRLILCYPLVIFKGFSQTWFCAISCIWRISLLFRLGVFGSHSAAKTYSLLPLHSSRYLSCAFWGLKTPIRILGWSEVYWSSPDSHVNRHRGVITFRDFTDCKTLFSDPSLNWLEWVLTAFRWWPYPVKLSESMDPFKWNPSHD